MTPKEYLMQIYNVNKKINSKLSERDEIMKTLIRSTDTSKENIHTLDVGRPTEDTVIRLMRYNDEANQYTDELVELKVRIAEEIMKLENENNRIVLRERYIHCKSFEEIAVNEGYVYRHIIRLHGQALEDFERTFPEKFTDKTCPTMS